MTRERILEILKIQEETIDMLIEINDGDETKVIKNLEKMAEKKAEKKLAEKANENN